MSRGAILAHRLLFSFSTQFPAGSSHNPVGLAMARREGVCNPQGRSPRVFEPVKRLFLTDTRPMTLAVPPASVSAVIPAYNSGHLVGDAIESALAQTLPPAQIV